MSLRGPRARVRDGLLGISELASRSLGVPVLGSGRTGRCPVAGHLTPTQVDSTVLRWLIVSHLPADSLARVRRPDAAQVAHDVPLGSPRARKETQVSSHWTPQHPGVPARACERLL